MQQTDFFQSGPRLENTYQSNRWLPAYLKRHLPAEYWQDVNHDLSQLGENCAGAFMDISRRAEREKPVHVPYDAWGARIDELRVSTAWQELQDIAARERLIHIGYHRPLGIHSRLYQFAKLYLFHPSSAFFTCPLAMADGAARVLEVYGQSEVHREAFAHLTSVNPADFWTSGQWMTEKTGGSDVSGTETVARMETDGKSAKLYGTKWFSSATTSQMALALARPEGAVEGSRGLSLFLVHTYKSPGQLNEIEILRLKEKLGTWALPTAELKLKGSRAHLVGEAGHGVKTVATMLNITRLYNSVCSIGQMTRGLDLLRDYSGKRRAFKNTLETHPLHLRVMVEEECKLLIGFMLTMEMVRLMGKEDLGQASEPEKDLLRLFTPIAKFFTARTAVETASQVVEGFGGAGYVEDTGIPVQLRDSQVFAIWEGATNVLSLDLIRVVQKTGAIRALQDDVARRLTEAATGPVADLVPMLKARWDSMAKTIHTWLESPPELQAANSRAVGFQLAWHYGMALLASWAHLESQSNVAVLRTWMLEILPQLREVGLASLSSCQNAEVAANGRLTLS